MNELNKELQLVHEFLKEEFRRELKSNKIKSRNDRLRWAHAVLITGTVAYEYEIREPLKTSEGEFYNTIYDE